MAKRGNPHGALACSRMLVLPWSVPDQAGAGPRLVAVAAARPQAVPGGQPLEVITETAHIAPIWPVSAVPDAEPMFTHNGGYSLTYAWQGPVTGRGRISAR
jgi:hypothetical protein